jgi:hypothetical protein
LDIGDHIVTWMLHLGEPVGRLAHPSEAIAGGGLMVDVPVYRRRRLSVLSFLTDCISRFDAGTMNCPGKCRTCVTRGQSAGFDRSKNAIDNNDKLSFERPGDQHSGSIFQSMAGHYTVNVETVDRVPGLGVQEFDTTTKEFNMIVQKLNPPSFHIPIFPVELRLD